jgi:hypothetical protein
MVPDDVMAEHRATATSAGEPNRSGGGHYRLDLVCRGLVLVRLGLSPIDIKLTHYPIEAAQSLAGRTVSTAREPPPGSGFSSSASGFVRSIQDAQSFGCSTATCRSWYGATSGPGAVVSMVKEGG